MPITLRNTTNYIAQFVIRKGGQIIARLPGIAPEAQMVVPTEGTYQVTAMTIIDGNTYTSAPMDVTGACSFLAQVLQVPQQGAYEFDVVQGHSTRPDQMQFQKTTLSPVTFTIDKDGVPMQAVVVADSFSMETLDISDTFHIYAVVNGVTTDTVSTANPNAEVTATSDTSTLEQGYFTLDVG
ncbi:hypothetical protein LVB77_09945 [Lysobacter sp. 5GHs7-4]|uniref:hypothetical protein n=1 Tax=Lysobacter sp. 5GHs7-4 TaxID=2904253 RepID=UPI001E30A8BB|nr:hypothetical protein [Lysobacter sp. 5GHs7-4]UHQ24964.1 hypothetical protein LVB77_09945 [Lysobacter sp. 5GHs7-4]